MKTKIKTTLLVLTLVFLLPKRSVSQGMPVYDNTNFVSLTKSLVESAKQTSELLKTVKFLKEQKDRIVQVSNVIKQLNAVKELYRNNQKLYNMVQNDLRDILNSSYIKAEEVNRISESFDTIIGRSLEDLDFVNQVLSSDNLKMTDAERTVFLKDKELQSREMVAEITQRTKRYHEIISFREMQDKINHREATY